MFKKLVSRLDGFVNRITGYGTARDHGEQTKWSTSAKIPKHVIDDFYAMHELAWKIIDTGPTYGMRKWIKLKIENESKRKKAEKIIKDSGFRKALKRALKLNNAYGALLYVVLDDGGMDQAEPVDFSRIKGIQSVEVIERGYIEPIFTGRSLRHELYRIDLEQGMGAAFDVKVHKSRLIRIPGAEVSADWLMLNDGWPPSKLERAFTPLRDLSSAYSLLPNIVKDIIRDVVKLQGLNDLSINDSEEHQKAFNDRLDAMFLAQSMINKLVIDTEDEYERQATNINGVSDLIRLLERRVVAVSGQPHSYLLGESPGNSIGGQTGESQDRDLNKYVECYQEDEIKEPIEEFLNFVEPIVDEESIDFVFNPVSSQTLEQQALVFEKVANGAAKLTDAQVISPQEAATPFEGGEITIGFTLDQDARAKLKTNDSRLKQMLSAGMEDNDVKEKDPRGPGRARNPVSNNSHRKAVSRNGSRCKAGHQRRF